MRLLYGFSDAPRSPSSSEPPFADSLKAQRR